MMCIEPLCVLKPRASASNARLMLLQCRRRESCHQSDLFRRVAAHQAQLECLIIAAGMCCPPNLLLALTHETFLRTHRESLNYNGNTPQHCKRRVGAQHECWQTSETSDTRTDERGSREGKSPLLPKTLWAQTKISPGTQDNRLTQY